MLRAMAASLQLEAVPGARPGQRVLRMVGRLGLESVPEFLNSVRSAGEPVLILDFSGVSFIDSAGVGSLIQTMASFKKANRRLALAGVNDRVRAVLEITRVQALLPNFPTVADAEQNLN
jgi:anti-sigma B factor antagonist